MIVICDVLGGVVLEDLPAKVVLPYKTRVQITESQYNRSAILRRRVQDGTVKLLEHPPSVVGKVQARVPVPVNRESALRKENERLLAQNAELRSAVSEKRVQVDELNSKLDIILAALGELKSNRPVVQVQEPAKQSSSNSVVGDESEVVEVDTVYIPEPDLEAVGKANFTVEEEKGTDTSSAVNALRRLRRGK